MCIVTYWVRNAALFNQAGETNPADVQKANPAPGKGSGIPVNLWQALPASTETKGAADMGRETRWQANMDTVL